MRIQFTIRRLLFLTVIVAVLFGGVGKYWPLGTAVAVVALVGAGTVLLAFGSIRSWKLVVWTCAVFLGSLLSIRHALDLRRVWETCQQWPSRTLEAIVLLAGALVSGILAAGILAMIGRKPKNIPAFDATEPKLDKQQD